MRLNRSRMRPVLRKSRCRSSTMIRKMRPAASLRGRDGGRMMPSCVGGGGAASRLCTRPPCTSVSDGMSCLTPSSKTLEIVLRQVGDELVAIVADDGVHRHEVDGATEGRLLCRWWLRGAGAAAAPLGPAERQHRRARARTTPTPRRVQLVLPYRQYKTVGRAGFGPDAGRHVPQGACAERFRTTAGHARASRPVLER